jgi:carbohydrate kinase (thermoresistant glucokinase family)
VRSAIDRPQVAVIMGVSGAGKTTVGRRLAQRLSWSFTEGDGLHPRQNVAKMKIGQPLTDADRVPWLAAIGKIVDGWISRGECGVITCSALRRSYRRQIVGDRQTVRLVYLEGVPELIAKRLATRKNHFMPASLLDSQFATLEPPATDENPITVGVDRPIEEIVDHVIGILSSPARSPQ